MKSMDNTNKTDEIQPLLDKRIMGIRKSLRNRIVNYINMTNKIKEWKIYNEPELEVIIKIVEKFPREEVSTFYSPYLTDELAEKLMQIGEAYKHNTPMICNIISAIGNMINRYGVKPTDQLFSFVRQFIGQPKMDYFLAIHIDSFPQFNNSNDKWDYVMSIPDIKPKSKSFPIFVSKIRRILNKNEMIPNEYLDKIVAIFKSKVEEMETKQKTDAIKYYREMVEKVQAEKERTKIDNSIK